MKHTLVWIDEEGKSNFDYRPVHMYTADATTSKSSRRKSAFTDTDGEAISGRIHVYPEKFQDQGTASISRRSGAKNTRTFKVYRWTPDDGQNPRIDTYEVDLDNVRSDGSRRPDQDQERNRLDAHVSPFLP